MHLKTSIQRLILIILAAFHLSYLNHEVYISSMEMVIQGPDRDVQITLRVFTDDLEAVLQNRSTPILQLDPDHAAEEVDALVAVYLEEVIQIKSPLEQVALHFLGKEYRDDLTLLYLEGQIKPTTRQITLSHRLFLDALPTQQNVVHIKQSNQRKSFLFDANHFERTLELTP